MRLAAWKNDWYLRDVDHHVYFWLESEGVSPAQRAEFELGLASLFEIPFVKSGRWSVPAKVMVRPVVDQSWDYALTMVFESVQDHDAYQVDADHLLFIEKFKKLWAQVQIKDLA